MLRSRLSRLFQDNTGSMAIETAIVTPVLLLMSLGAFEVSGMVAKQHELQSAAAEAEALVLAGITDGPSIKTMIMQSTDLEADQVTVAPTYRCANDDFANDPALCASPAETSTFLQITLTFTREPIWVELGLGETMNYNVVRTVQIS